MQTARKAVALARCRSALIMLVVLSFVPMMVQRCSMPARGQEQHGKQPPPATQSSPPSPGTGTAGSTHTAQVSGALRDSFPAAVSYPATALLPLRDSIVMNRLYDLSCGGSIKPAASVRLTSLPGGAVRRAWYESQPHPLLAKLLPDVRVLHEVYNLAGEHIDFTYDWVLRDGKLYRLDGLNRLLLDAGFTFDTVEMRTTAKIAVMFAMFAESFRPHRDTLNPMAAYSQTTCGFPAITFLSVKKGDWQHPKHKDVRRGVLLDCMVNGVRQSFFVEYTGRARAEPEFLYRKQGEFLIRFDGIPLPLPAPRQQRGARPADNPQWALAVTCDGSVWSEQESTGGAMHYFIAADTNATTTFDTMAIVITGVTTCSAYLRFWRVQTQTPAWESAAATGGTAILGISGTQYSLDIARFNGLC